MKRRNTLKSLAITSAIFSFIPAIVYYVMNARALHNGKSIIKLNELYMLFAVTFIAFVCHVGVSFVSNSVGLGAGFFVVSIFVQATVIAALVMFYKAARYTHYNPSQSSSTTVTN